MKISKTKLKRIIREEKMKLLREAGMEPGIFPEHPSSPRAREQAKDILVQVALYFIYKDENPTGAEIYNEVFRRASGAALEDQELADAIDALATEYGEI